MFLSLRTLRVLLTSTLILSAVSVIPAQATAFVTPPDGHAVVGPVVAAPGSPTSAEEKPSAVTSAGGAFRFDGLERGTHQLYLDTSSLPSELRPAAGAPRVEMWLNPGQSLVSDPIGAGVRFSASYDRGGSTISGVVFMDYDADGRQDPGEPGLAGVTVIDPNIHQYFVPFDDQDLIAMFDASNECQPDFIENGVLFVVGNRLASRISLTASADDTVFYYDHWEDGYDPDPLSPGSTTEVGVLDAGKTHIFEDDVDTADPAWGTTLYYDGRDRITIFGEAASVIRGASPSLTDSPIGTRLAGAWEIDEAANWGTEYIVPAGEDWAVPDSDFSFTAASITALEAGTQIFYNGTPVVTTATDGETYFIPGGGDGTGLQSGDQITADGPIQVHAYSSACAPVEVWSGNGYTLEPRDEWSSNYWSPVPSRAAGPTCRNDAEMDIFLYNDNGAPITLNIDDGTIPPYTPILPAGTFTTVRALIGTSLSITRGVHIQGDGPFWGIVNMDTRGADHEWGYSLIPENQLSSQVVLGWSPGNDLTPPLAQWPPSGNLAFVTAVTDTVIFADFDQDGNPDTMDCNGDGDALDTLVDNLCDETTSDGGVPLAQGLTLRIADPFDADLTGALIYTQDLSQKIAVAWGQDPCVADSSLPYIDMGYTVLPVAIPSLTKTDALAEDVDGSGDITPGDILTYTVVIANNGQGPMTNVVLTDVLPYTYTDFIVGSIVSTLPTTFDEYFDGAVWTYTPTATPPNDTDANVQQFRLGWPTIDAGETVTVTFNVWIQTDIPRDVDEITNVAVVNSDETTRRDSEDPDDPGDPDTDTLLGQPILWLDKHPSDPGTVAPGGVLTYTIVVSNVGTATALSALVVDDLPPWLTYIDNTLDLTWPTGDVITTVTPISQVIGTFTDTYGDNFDLADHLPGTTDYAGNDGTLTWLTDWIEIDPSAGAPTSTGDIRIIVDETLAHTPHSSLFLRGNDADEERIQRCADLSDFAEPHLSYQLRGDANNDEPDDLYRVEITSTTSISTYTPLEPYADTDYIPVDLNLSDFAGESLVCVTYVVGAGMDSVDAARERYRIDDVFIYDAAPDRYGTFNLIEETAIFSYSTFTDINPADYMRDPSDPFTPAITHTMRITDAFLFLPGSNVTASFQVRVGYPLTDDLQMFNTASITATNLITTPYPLTDTVPTLIQSSHALTITKTDDPDPVIPGELLTYTLVWEVGGDEPAPGVVVSDTLPLPYVSFVSCAPLPECQGETTPGSGVVTWDLGDRLPPMSQITRDGGTLTLTVRVEQSPPTGVFTNTVIIDDATDTPTDEDDEPTRVPASYMLSKQRLTDAWVNISDTVQFLIVITNTGTMTITRLPLEDQYDTTYLSYQGADPPSEDNLDDGVINWSDLTTIFGPVVPGDDVQVTVNFVAISSTQHLSPPVTINTAISEGAMTQLGDLPRQEDDAEVGIGVPDAIELLYLRANPKSGGVLVEWATLFEIGTYGFWLYRGQDEDLGSATPVAFIPAEGWFGLGATYQYLDAELPAGLFYYWLVEEEFSGTLTTYGPVSSGSGWDEADLPYRIYLPLLGK